MRSWWKFGQKALDKNEQWHEIRQQVLNRDKNQCQSCGRYPSGQVHHITPRSEGGGDNLSNLITLCGRCHMLISPVPIRINTKVWNLQPQEIVLVRKLIHKTIEKKSQLLRN